MMGPQYPSLGARVAKFRKIANPTRAQRVAHADAIEDAIRSLQRASLQRELPTIRPNCVSGTWINDNSKGELTKAIRSQQHDALLRHPAAVRKARTPAEWSAMYDAAMAEKRAREAMPAPRDAWQLRVVQGLAKSLGVKLTRKSALALCAA